MRLLLVTVAGCSTRFSRSLGREVIKCLYNEGDKSTSLLYRLLRQPVEFDKIIIVGGYRYNKLKTVIMEWFSDIIDRISVIENPYYAEYGSGYSLYIGLKEAVKYDFDEIVFAEGDLFLDSVSFTSVVNSKKSVITTNSEAILAKKAVAFYTDVRGIVHYIYDTSHNALVINEPFLGIYNSGQTWKFNNQLVVRNIFENMSEDSWKGTNLVFVENYFQALSGKEYEIINFNDWVNCNTVEDYRKTLRKENNE